MSPLEEIERQARMFEEILAKADITIAELEGMLGAAHVQRGKLRAAYEATVKLLAAARQPAALVPGRPRLSLVASNGDAR